MSSDLFEFYTRSEVSGIDISRAIANFFHLKPQEVMGGEVFWNCDLTDASPRVGIRTYHLGEGLKMRICIESNFEISDESLGGFAGYFAKYSGVETVIGDYRAELLSAHMFLVYFPDGRIAEAFENSKGSAQDVVVHRFL